MNVLVYSAIHFISVFPLASLCLVYLVESFEYAAGNLHLDLDYLKPRWSLSSTYLTLLMIQAAVDGQSFISSMHLEIISRGILNTLAATYSLPAYSLAIWIIAELITAHRSWIFKTVGPGWPDVLILLGQRWFWMICPNVQKNFLGAQKCSRL